MLKQENKVIVLHKVALPTSSFQLPTQLSMMGVVQAHSETTILKILGLNCTLGCL